MTTPYIILRNLSLPSTQEPFTHFAGSIKISLKEAAAIPPFPVYRLESPSLSSKDVHDLARDPTVAAITRPIPTRLIAPRDEGSVASGGAAWGIEAVGATTSTRTGLGATVAVLDTGIDRSHGAFAGVEIVERDFSGDGDGDVAGHGTHCAGTILGRDVGGVRIGVARGVTRLLVGKVLGNDGSGDSDMLFRGLQWALEEGADVVSMSLGFDFPGLVAKLSQRWPVDFATSVALEAYRGNLRMFDAMMAVNRARAPFGGGAVVVAAAGNESHRDTDPEHKIGASLPAAAEGVLSVGALERGSHGLRIASFSNTFPQLAAPGVAIDSARAGGGLWTLSGTSMACPHVAGICALWWEHVRASNLPARADTVAANVLAHARTDALAPSIDAADRGVGLAVAP